MTSRQEPLAPWTIYVVGVQVEGVLHLLRDDAGMMLTALPESRKARSSCDSTRMGSTTGGGIVGLPWGRYIYPRPCVSDLGAGRVSKKRCDVDSYASPSALVRRTWSGNERQSFQLCPWDRWKGQNIRKRHSLVLWPPRRHQKHASLGGVHASGRSRES